MSEEKKTFIEVEATYESPKPQGVSITHYNNASVAKVEDGREIRLIISADGVGYIIETLRPLEKGMSEDSKRPVISEVKNGILFTGVKYTKFALDVIIYMIQTRELIYNNTVEETVSHYTWEPNEKQEGQ